MTCFIARNLLSELVDDALEPARAHGLRGHLAGCPDCARELEELRGLRSALRSMPVRRAPADFLEKVRAKAERKSVLERVGGVLAPVLRLPRVAQGGLALAASLVVAVTVHLNNEQGGKSVWEMDGAPGARVVVQAKSTPSTLADEAPPTEEIAGAKPEESKTEGAPADGLSALARTGTAPPPPSTEAGPAKAKLAKDDAGPAGGKGAGVRGSTVVADESQPGSLDARGKAASELGLGGVSSQGASSPAARSGRGAGASGTLGSGTRSGGSGPVEAGLYATDPAAAAPAQAAAATPREAQRPSSNAASGSVDRNRAVTRDQVASSAEPSFDDAPSSAPEPSFGEPEPVATPRRSESAARESKKASAPAAAAAPAPNTDWGSGASGGDDSFGSPDSDGAFAKESTFEEEAEADPAPAKIAERPAEKRTDAKASQVGVRYRSAEADAPRKVADAARARRGTVVSGNPPSLGRAGASTVVIVEIPADELDGFRTFLEDFGTLEILGTPSGSRLRLRVEVIRE